MRPFSPPMQLAAFGAVLALLFGGGALAGELIDPDARVEDAAHRKDMEMTEAPEVHGLAVADGGLRVIVDRPELRRGREEQLAFRIVDARGATVRDFDVEQTKRMHLILVSRNSAGFQHLHPTRSDDGTWSVPVTLADEIGRAHV